LKYKLMANIYQRFISRIASEIEKRSITMDYTQSCGLPYGFSASPLSLQGAMKLSAVYRCVEVVSDAIASQIWEVLKYTSASGWLIDEFDEVGYMMNNEPSPSMSRFVMMKTLVSKTLLEGNGHIIIRRDFRGDPIRLDLVSGNVTMFKRPNGSIYYKVAHMGYEVGFSSGFIEQVEGEDMIHILNFSYDGYTGVSTLRHAANSMGIATASEASAKGFFESGANYSGIITGEGKITKLQADAIKLSWAQAFDQTTGTPGGIAVMEGGLKFTPVTVNPKDAQMLESRQFNVVDICRFFGTHPSKVFDSANLTYSNIEAFQLGFLSDTISPFDSKIEAEFNRKLLRPSQRRITRLNLNMDELLRANLDAKSNYYRKMLETGAYSPNEIAGKVGQPKVKGGDKRYVPMNLIPVDAPVTKNTKVDKNIKIEDNGDDDE